MEKLFIIRKFIMAKTMESAIKKDKRTPVDEVWLDEEWKKEMIHRQQSSTAYLRKKK
jgi:hypothetical protein